MRCPKCGHLDDKVVESRASEDGCVIRRRRECLACQTRFTTYEEIHHEKLRVIKRDGRFEDFDRAKLIAGIARACEKRPISAERIEALAERVLTDLVHEYGQEIPTQAIGESVMAQLRKLDEVAYVRFASVYRQFRDADQFIEEIQQLNRK